MNPEVPHSTITVGIHQPLPLLVESHVMHTQQSLKGNPYSFRALFLCRASHLEFCITISGCFYLLKLQFPSPQLSKALNGFLLPVPISENCLLALSQEDLRAYFICSLLSQTMVCTAWCPITKNSHSIPFVQLYGRLKLVTVLPQRMKAEFLMPFWW